MHINNKCYKIYYYNENMKIWGMQEAGMVNIYLIEGDEKALAIDTGYGIGNIRETMESLTDKPIMVVNTHNHPDHVGGNGAFEKAYMLDVEIETDINAFEYSIKEKKESIKRFFQNNGIIPDFSVEAVTDWGKSEISQLYAGQIINLGSDRDIEVIHANGHTKGSICLLDKKARTLFTGDSANHGVLIGGMKGQYVSQHYETMKKLLKRKDEFDYILLGHGDKHESARQIENIMSAEEDIMTGKGKYEPCNETFWPSELVYRKGNVFIGFDMDHI